MQLPYSYERVTVQPSANCYCIRPLKIAFGEGRMPAAATFSYGLRSECADLPELLHERITYELGN